MPRFTFSHLLLPLLVVALLGGIADAQLMIARDLLVRARNNNPEFLVRLAVDQADHVYEEGETLTATVLSEETGYLYLVYCNAADETYCVFPNKHEADNRIVKGKPVTIPGAQSQFDLEIGGPNFGREVLKAIVSKEKLQGDLSEKNLTRNAVTQLNAKALKDLLVRVRRRPGRQWAEHAVEITTVRKGGVQRGRQMRRILLCIGISQFQDRRVRDLSVCHKDAERIAKLLKNVGGVDQVILLTDEKATKEAIETAITKTIREATQPGDEVIVFWSGHGGRCADDGGDEQDGYDEYLVPTDAKLGSLEEIRESMVLDDQFGRWVQTLDGRRIAIILDTCFSGGQAASAKGTVSLPPKSLVEFDFFDKELSRLKDLGQKQLVILSSSQANQISLERKEGDLSVMTYALSKAIEGSNGLTVDEAYKVLKTQVPEYVRKNFPGYEQTPLLDGTLSPPLKLR